jgi:hypothetical protein
MAPAIGWSKLLGYMEKNMRKPNLRQLETKTNDTSNLDHDTLEDNNTLADHKLATVTGGMFQRSAERHMFYRQVL